MTSINGLEGILSAIQTAIANRSLYNPHRVRIKIFTCFVLASIVTAVLGFSSIHLVHDKVAHFTCFYLLTFLFYWLIDFGQSFTILVGVSFIVCTVSGSIVSEFLQGIVNPARVYDTQDIIANIAGSCSGLISAIALQLYKVSRRMETYQELPMSQI